MADFVHENAEFRVESNKTMTELKNEVMNGKDLNYNYCTLGVVDHKNSAYFINVNGNSSVSEKVKLDVSESEKNDVFTEEESILVDNSGTDDKNETVLNVAVENSELYSRNGSVLSDNGNLYLGGDEINGKYEPENGVLVVKNVSGVVEEVIDPKNDAHDAGSKAEKSVILINEHQALEIEKEEGDYSNGRSLEREVDGTLAAVAEGAELEHTNLVVELGPEQEEKDKSELACENGEVEPIEDVCKADEPRTETYEHQAVETEKGADYSNGKSLESEEDGTLDVVAEGAELEEDTNSKVELRQEIEEEAKSEPSCENGEVKDIVDGKVEESGIGTFEHQGAETEKEDDYGNGRPLKSEEDGTLAAVAEGAELEGHSNPKVELGTEEEKAESKLDCENGEAEAITDVAKVEESGIETYEHQAAETEKEETDYSNGRSLESEEDGALTAVRELEEQTNSKVELGLEQEEKAKSDLACENAEVEAIADVGKVEDVSADSNSVINDDSASGEAEPLNPKPLNEEPIKTRSWRDIAIDGIDSVPDKVQFMSRTPMIRRSVPKFVKSVVRSVDVKGKFESEVFQTRSINVARSNEVKIPSLAYEESQTEASLDEKFKFRESTIEEKLEQVKDCKLEYGAALFAKREEMEVGQKYMNTSTIVGTNREEQVKEDKWKKEQEEKARKEEKLRKRKEAEEEKLREEDAKKERLRKEKEAAELRKRLVAEEVEKMRKAEELNKKKKAEKLQKRAEFKAQKEAKEKEKKKAKKNKKQAGTSDTSSVSSEVSASSPEKNSPEASRSAVSKKPVVFSSSKKKSNIPKDPLPLPLTLRNRSKRRLMKWTWPLLVPLVVLALFFAGNYISSESFSLSFAF